MAYNHVNESEEYKPQYLYLEDFPIMLPPKKNEDAAADDDEEDRGVVVIEIL